MNSLRSYAMFAINRCISHQQNLQSGLGNRISAHLQQRSLYISSTLNHGDSGSSSSDEGCSRAEQQAKKLREKTPIGKLDELEGKHPYQEKEPLKPFPGGVNPKTGEVGGPAGPEPTRYGDWERKGRVTDF